MGVYFPLLQMAKIMFFLYFSKFHGIIKLAFLLGKQGN